MALVEREVVCVSLRWYVYKKLNVYPVNMDWEYTHTHKYSRLERKLLRIFLVPTSLAVVSFLNYLEEKSFRKHEIDQQLM